MVRSGLLYRLLAALGLVPYAAEPSEAPAAPTPTGAADRDLLQDGIPPSAKERVALIISLIDEIQARRRECPDVADLGEIERMRSTHLPRLIKSYVEIPAEHRAEVFRETGRSASYLLNDRLDKMIARLREISKMLAQGDVDAFSQNLRFIDAHYDSSLSPFET
jgi:hypothetical protein